MKPFHKSSHGRPIGAEGCAIHTPISHQQLKALEPYLSQRKIETGQYICRYNEQGAELYIILAGSVEIARLGGAGRKIILAQRHAGEVVGEISVLSGVPRTADVIALTPTIIGVLARADLERAFTKVPSFGVYLLEVLARRLAQSSQQSVDFATCDVPTRVLKVLRSISTDCSHGAIKPGVVKRRPTHEELAQMVGSSREVVTRAIKLLEQSGEIKVDGERLVVNC